MDIWGVLALIFGGAFFALMLVALFYWRSVRPRLLSLTQQPAAVPGDDLRNTIQALNENLVRHSALVARLPSAFNLRAGEGDPGPLLDDLARLQQELAALQDRLPESFALPEEDREVFNAIKSAQLDQSLSLERLTMQLEKLRAASSEDDAVPYREMLHAVEALQEEQSTLARRILATEPATAPDSGVMEPILTRLGEQSALLDRLDRELSTIEAQTGAVSPQASYGALGSLNEHALSISAALFTLEQQLDRLEVLHAPDPQGAQESSMSTVRGLIASLKQHYRTMNEALVQAGWSISRLTNGSDTVDGAALADAYDQSRTLREGNAHMREDAEGLAQEIERLQVSLELETEPTPPELVLLDEVRSVVLGMQGGYGQLESAIKALTDEHERLQERFDSFVVSRRASARLQDIKGIGAVYAERLQAAGITTFEQLAGAPPDWILEIVKAPGGLRPNTENWIKQAKAFMEEFEDYNDNETDDKA